MKTKNILIQIMLLLGLAISTFSYAKTEEKFNVDTFFGWDGSFRPKVWSPIELNILSELDDPIQVYVKIATDQDNSNRLEVFHEVVLMPQIPVRLPLVTKMDYAQDNCVVSIIAQDGKVLWNQKYDVWDPSTQSTVIQYLNESDFLIGSCGRIDSGLKTINDYMHSEYNRSDIDLDDGDNRYYYGDNNNSGTIYYSNKLPNMMPLDWTGFESLDVLLLHDPSWNQFSHQQLTAIVQWVKNGGNLIVIAGSNANFNQNEIMQVMPCGLGERFNVDLKTDDLLDIGLRNLSPQKVFLTELTLSDNSNIEKTVKIDGKVCFTLGKVGFGRVAVLGIDPLELNQNPENAALMWQTILNDVTITENMKSKPLMLKSGLRLINDGKLNEDDFNQWATHQSSQSQRALNSLITYMYNIPEMRPISVWWVILVLLLLAIIIGPVDYIILKRKDKLPLTWITTLFWIITFTVSAYFFVDWLRSGELQMRGVSIVDAIQGEPHSWQSDFVGIYAPESDLYEIDSSVENGWTSGISPANDYYSYRSNIASRLIQCRQQDGQNTVSSLPISIWTMQCIMQQGKVNRLPISADITITDGKVIGSINNFSDKILNDVEIVTKDRIYRVGDINARDTFELTADKKLLNNIYSNDSTDADKKMNSYESLVPEKKTLINSIYATGVYPRTNAIYEYLDAGAFLIRGWYKDSDMPLKIKNKNCNYDHTEFVRLITFDKNKRGEL